MWNLYCKSRSTPSSHLQQARPRRGEVEERTEIHRDAVLSVAATIASVIGPILEAIASLTTITLVDQKDREVLLIV